MSILIEEEKQSVNWVSVGVTLVIVIFVFFSVYYILFKKPELIEIVSPAPLEELKKITSITFSPDAVLNNPVFRSLKSAAPQPQPPSPGRSNPFLPF